MLNGSVRGARRSLRTPTVLLALLSLAACGSPAGVSGPVDGAAAMAHVEKIVAIGPRPFGSQNLAKAADYIESQVTALGLKLQRHEVELEKEKKLVRNLWTQIDGEDPASGPILMLGAHYDTKLADGHDDAAHNFPFVGAIDGTGAPAILLELARVLKAQKPKCNVWLYWIDAEESIDWVWNDARALLGSDAFCKKLQADGTLKRVKAFVLLDLMGSKNVKFDKDGESSSKLMAMFDEAGVAMGIGERMFQFPTQQTIRWCTENGRDWGIKDDHLSFKKRGVPSMLLIDFQLRIPPQNQNLNAGQQPEIDPNYEQWWHSPDDTPAAMDADSLAIAGNLVMKAFPKLESFVLGK
ncbi:MAG: M28 family peptidase [Planctomycetes bacterium]|nr:M28 family peptidase [Planctomycetota bacterium]